MPPKKASAPRPKQGGYEAAKARIERAKQVQQVTVSDTGVVFTYNLAAIPIRIRSYIREQTGMSVEELIGIGVGRIQVDSYCDLWWVSRLVAGEIIDDPYPHPVTRREVQDEWDARCSGVLLAEIDDDPLDADPEPEGQPS